MCILVYRMGGISQRMSALTYSLARGVEKIIYNITSRFDIFLRFK